MKLGLSYDRRYGQLEISDGVHETTVFHSTVLSRDALGELAEAVIRVLQSADRATCAWADEPGEYRWILERHGDEVHITILWFRESFSRQADEKGELHFSVVGKLRRFALQVKNVLQQEIEAGAYPGGPPSSYAKLDALFRKTK